MTSTQNVRIAIFYGFLLILGGCSSLKNIQTSQKLNHSFKRSPVLSKHFTGFILMDPITGEYLKNHNGNLHFTPASNTKVLTLLACLSTLEDSLPSFRIEDADTLKLFPFGDPTLLHPDFPEQPVLNILQQKPAKIFLPEKKLPPFGPGWAWDDYQFSFQPERSWCPAFANEVRIISHDSLEITPSFFEDYINVHIGQRSGDWVYRERDFNLFHIWMQDDTATFERKIPFKTSDELLEALLKDTLKTELNICQSNDRPDGRIIYNQALLPVLSLMMLRSDNFLAEQLLIVAARKSGYTSLEAFRSSLMQQWNLPNDIRWVDGSGLSRYNLITPMVMAEVLHKIYKTADWETISALFPAGGVSGTIKNWYNDHQPYVFAKTGTLSNNHCLSGYIVTKSGRRLIFSFMNNNYLSTSTPVKAEMQEILELVRDRY